MEEMKSKVYILTDEQGRVVRCEGGYTMQNIQNIEDWIFVDGGEGDKYNLCQTHYFEGGLYTTDFIPRYKWDGEKVVERTKEEIEADKPAPVEPDPVPTGDDSIWADMATAIEEGVNDV